MKIKFKTNDGEIIAMGSMPNLSAGPGEKVIDSNAKIPPILRHWKIVNDQLVEKTQQEKDDADAKIKKIKKSEYDSVYSGLNSSDQKKVTDEIIARLAITMLTEQELQDIINA